MRVFTAAFLPDDVSAHLDLALASVGGPLVGDSGIGGVRWTPREQRHITIAFHGEVPDGLVPGYVYELEAALREIPPFECALSGSGTFRDRSLWAGIDVPGQAGVSLLADAAIRAEQAVGLDVTDRLPRRPHLTLARASRRTQPQGRGGTNRGGQRRPLGDETLAAWAAALSVYRGPSWTIGEVHFVRSDLGEGPSGGSLYTTEARLRIG
jgi:2'-5' RNA ligase